MGQNFLQIKSICNFIFFLAFHLHIDKGAHCRTYAHQMTHDFDFSFLGSNSNISCIQCGNKKCKRLGFFFLSHCLMFKVAIKYRSNAIKSVNYSFFNEIKWWEKYEIIVRNEWNMTFLYFIERKTNFCANI